MQSLDAEPRKAQALVSVPHSSLAIANRSALTPMSGLSASGLHSVEAMHALLHSTRTRVVTRLVEEFSVRVLSEQGFSDSRGRRVFEKLQASLEGVVDVNLAVAASNHDASS